MIGAFGNFSRIDRTSATAAAPPETLPTPSNVALDVRVHVPDNLIVRGDDVRIGGRGMSLGNVNITLGGDIHATKAAGAEPRVAGEIRTIRGFYDFEGRRFDVARDGHVTFNGPDPTDPALDITASRDISGVEATVRVHGTVQKPAIALSSTPPLEQAVAPPVADERKGRGSSKLEPKSEVEVVDAELPRPVRRDEASRLEAQKQRS